jgi:hypothetical protein
MTGLILLYRSNAEFHGLVSNLLAHLPQWAITLISAATWLYSWYRNGQKQNGNGGGSGPGIVLPIAKSGKGLVGGISNPMRIVAVALLLVVGLCLPAAGQTPTPSPSPSPTPSAEPNEGVKFDVRTKFTRLLNGANATTVEGRLPISPRYSFLYSQTQIPSAGAQIYTGNIEFREKLSHLVKSSSAQVNLDAIQVYVSGGMGTKRDDSGNNPTFAWNIVGGADLKIGQIGGGTLGVGFSVGYIGVPKERAGPKSFVLSSTAQIAPELTLKF